MHKLANLFLILFFFFTANFASASSLDLLCGEDITKLKDLVAEPQVYKNKKIKIVGDFYSFTSLSLDYPRAFRDSKKYIGLVLARPDQAQIPLVELKLAAKLELFKDEKKPLIIEHGDQIKIDAKVYEVALGEPWLEVSSIKIIRKNNG
ncbi:MAG: hypothetical protein MK033_08490 [Candidatus Caenarcaniphilales bacterium]|nr:hypothetical protein [Candidatus Caenarcaniphilales bacterium]